MAWYDNSWSYRVKITIDADEVDAAVTDFPVFVDLSDMPSEFFSNVKSDGGDIRVTTSDETTEIPREVVAISTGGSTGQLYFKASLSDTVDSEFYIYYGNSGASEPAVTGTYGRNNVWSGYSGVWHFQEDPSGSSPQGVNSTGSGEDFASEGTMTGGDLVDGLVGKGWDLDGTDDAANASGFNYGTAGTGMIIFKPAGTTNKQLLDTGTTDQGLNVQIYNSGGAKVYARIDTAAFMNSTSSISAGTNYCAHITWTGTNHYLYFNGSQQDSQASTDVPATSDYELRVGHSASGGEHFAGVIDEVRFSNTAFASGYISTEYANLSSPATFYSIAAEEELELAPVAEFSAGATSGYRPAEITFTDESLYTPTSWSWDFGDTNTSTDQNPVHTYVSNGSYTVTLTATNAHGSDDEVKTNYITVTEAPEPADPDRPTGRATKEIAFRYPVTNGLVAGSTKTTGRVFHLKAVKSFVRSRDKVGF